MHNDVLCVYRVIALVGMFMCDCSHDTVVWENEVELKAVCV